ncbi:SpoIIE family protein phosphatase [bacterium]|nr:SpoIIE family protein phosphatase [bacterium]
MNELDQNLGNQQSNSTLLIVDDDQEVLSSLSIFLELDTDYDVSTFQSPKQALQMLKEKPVDLVISDYLMPDMNGLEFLAEVKKIYPETARILLTGYADKQNAIRAINEVGLFQYLEKPWDNDQFKLIIRNALSNKTLTESLQEKIHDLDLMLRQRDSLAARQEAIQKELLLARKLQERTLPQSLPDMKGLSFAAKYQPAFEIGGDFYDLMPLSNGRLAVLIADITGHGIQAALSTTLLKFAFRSFESRDVGPAEILSGMNFALFKVLPEDVFVAALTLIIDLADFRCTIANGGVPYPLLLKSPERTAELIPASGLVLGAVDSEHYRQGEERDLDLREGDALLLYTDGLSEIENGDGEQFGANSMRQVIAGQSTKPMQELVANLIIEAKKFGKDGQQSDDITILSMERTHTPKDHK